MAASTAHHNRISPRFVAIAIVFLLGCSHHANAFGDLPPGVPDIVNTTLGQVQGVKAVAANVRYFLHIPFAASTGGDNQFRPPQPRQSWQGVLDASTWGAGCIQPHHNPDVPANQSFDCLNVNVFVPIAVATSSSTSSSSTSSSNSSSSSSPSLPVMVFLHGGAWLEGSNIGPFGIYSGAYFASQNGVIVVTLNYRLGVYGWLACNTPSSDPSVSGNFGIMDQVAGLRWVQDNIANFGGDPTAVTLFGESAGAMSIGIHLTSPHSKGLFHQAIMESNVGGFYYKNFTDAAVYGDTFCSLLNCTLPGENSCNLTCVRQLNQYQVQDAWNTATGNILDFLLTNLGHILDGLLGTGPTIDGTYLTQEPLQAVEEGSYWGSTIPLMIGTNSNEGETFIYDGVDFELPGFLVPFAYLGIFAFNQTNVDLINQQPRYNTSAFADGRTPLSNVATDYWFRCASERFLVGVSKGTAGATPVFAYRYDHVYSNSSIFPTFGLPEICASVVCHASELPFVFHNVPNFTSFTPAESVFSGEMNRYWATFAKTGNPNFQGSAQYWPVWTPDNRTTLVLNLTSTVESTIGMCGFWDSLDSYFF